MAEPPAQHPLQPTQHTKAFVCVLKASIHCEGCKRKVKKILNQVQGVESVEVDTKQQKVTVTGTVDADTLIKKLAKSGKHAQLWPPQNPPKTEKNVVVVSNKEKKKTNESKSTQIDPQQENPTADKTNPKDSNHPPAKPPAAKHINGDGGVNGASSSSEASEVDSMKMAATATDATAEEPKKEDKKNDEERCTPAGDPPQTAEKKEAAVEKSIDRKGSGTSGKKKKKNGQSGNHSTNNEPAPPPAAAPPLAAENRVPGPPPQTNQIPPYNPAPHYYDYYYSGPSGNAPGPHIIGPSTQPAYAVSYNTAYPTSSYTAATYYSAPPNSYAYMHPGHETQQRPLDPELNIPRQPLDSFEMLSDENPNGCYVM